MERKCGICRHTFSSRSALSKHKETAKYCHDIAQNDSNHVEEFDANIETKVAISKSNMKCKYCEYETKVKSSLERHNLTCKLRPDLDEDQVNNEIIMLQQIKIEELAKKNTELEFKIKELTEALEKRDERLKNEIKELNFKLDCEKARLEGYERCHLAAKKVQKSRKADDTTDCSFTREMVDKNIHLFDFELYKRGAQGIADFIYKISDNGKAYYCSDNARHVFSRIVDGKIIKDKDGKFIDEICLSLRENAFERIDGYFKDLLHIEKYKHEEEPMVSRNHAVSLVQTLTDIIGSKQLTEQLLGMFRKEVVNVLTKLKN